MAHTVTTTEKPSILPLNEEREGGGSLKGITGPTQAKEALLEEQNRVVSTQKQLPVSRKPAVGRKQRQEREVSRKEADRKKKK